LLTAIPETFDLRALGKVTPVRDQGACGSCWTFATFGSLESNLLPLEPSDFSENNLKNTHGFDWGPCEGGNGDLSMAYLTRWSGPVDEAEDPYQAGSFISPSGLSMRKQVEEVLILPDRSGPLDNDVIKQAVMTYGGVYTTMNYTDSSYNPASYAYSYNGTGFSNHAVMIVGWDDQFDSTRFLAAPPGNGAYIIRNSWGADWGEGGYFYISYYDSHIGKSNYVFNNAESPTRYGHAYQYDPLGWTASFGYEGDTAWFANIFTAVSTEPLTAISFYTASLDSVYELYIYRKVAGGPTNGLLATSQSGTVSFAGYHTFPLDVPVSLVTGEPFSIVVKLTTPDFNYPVPVEYHYQGYNSGATANGGESFVSENGTDWTDITVEHANANVNLKGLTARNMAFMDVRSGHWAYAPILELFSAGITGGCSETPLNYCPEEFITRSQMAVFIETSLGHPSNSCTGRFADITPSHPFCGFIEHLATDGITAGCGNGNFCPDDPVTREQMAVFVEAALGNSPGICSGTRFADVTASNPFCGFIERLAADGITGGCGGGNFCPDTPVTRAQMAIFLVAAPTPLLP
jgi:C1A family cysteine protease